MRCGDDGPPESKGIRHSIRPGVAAPETVLVVDMGDGALFLQGWRHGPTAYVCAEDAKPLRRMLAVAFGDAEEPADPNEGGPL